MSNSIITTLIISITTIITVLICCCGVLGITYLCYYRKDKEAVVKELVDSITEMTPRDGSFSTDKDTATDETISVKYKNEAKDGKLTVIHENQTTQGLDISESDKDIEIIMADDADYNNNDDMILEGVRDSMVKKQQPGSPKLNLHKPDQSIFSDSISEMFTIDSQQAHDLLTASSTSTPGETPGNKHILNDKSKDIKIGKSVQNKSVNLTENIDSIAVTQNEINNITPKPETGDHITENNEFPTTKGRANLIRIGYNGTPGINQVKSSNEIKMDAKSKLIAPNLTFSDHIRGHV